MKISALQNMWKGELKIVQNQFYNNHLKIPKVERDLPMLRFVNLHSSYE